MQLIKSCSYVKRTETYFADLFYEKRFKRYSTSSVFKMVVAAMFKRYTERICRKVRDACFFLVKRVVQLFKIQDDGLR